jgi:sugar phosphate isomerase/epimerase
MNVSGESSKYGVGEDEVINNIIENLKRACDIGQKYGVMMAIENHGYLRQPDRFARVIDTMDSAWFGITLDSDNWDVPDPYAPFERFAPYAVNVHMKAVVTPQGQPSQPADLGRLMTALTDVGYRGYVGLEYEEAEDPYEAIPRLYQMMRDAA